jgi:hypothetical protein
MDMDFVRAGATVTITLDADMALAIMAGIRRMDAGWVASLSEEEANQKVGPDIHAVRILPNHIARALQDLRGTLDTAKIKL